MLVFAGPLLNDKALAIECPACFARAGVYCGSMVQSGAFHERRVNAAKKLKTKPLGPHGGVTIPGSQCPRCAEVLEYNGNYWCSSCDWILQEGAKGDDHLAFQLAYLLLMRQRGEFPDMDALARDVPS